MVKIKEKNTEEIILKAAKDIFQHKGMDGARMQEIADKAGINKAMLHYYYRSKQKLFEAVFRSALNTMVPVIIKIIDNEDHLFDKIRNFTDKYITFISRNSYMPLFLINELNRNPAIIKKILPEKLNNSIEQKLVNQINELIEKKEIKPVNPEQLLLDVISLSVFPILGKPLLSTVLNKNNKEYAKLIKKRKKYVAEFVIDAIKLKS
jgi:AcrR family transcriptional regulator